jgi:sec-independent protein translocase protein TatB
MFGISLPEFLVVAVIALLVLGPEKLPQVASQLGKLSFQLKKTSDSFRREFYNSVYKPTQENQQEIKTELRAIKHEASNLVVPKPEDEPQK